MWICHTDSQEVMDGLMDWSRWWAGGQMFLHSPTDWVRWCTDGRVLMECLMD